MVILSQLFPLLDEAATKPSFIKYYYEQSDALEQTGIPAGGKPTNLTSGVLLSALGSMQVLARLEAAGMRTAVDQGDWYEAVKRFRSAMTCLITGARCSIRCANLSQNFGSISFVKSPSVIAPYLHRSEQPLQCAQGFR